MSRGNVKYEREKFIGNEIQVDLSIISRLASSYRGIFLSNFSGQDNQNGRHHPEKWFTKWFRAFEIFVLGYLKWAKTSKIVVSKVVCGEVVKLSRFL